MLIVIFCQDCDPNGIGRHRLCDKHRRERQRQAALNRWNMFREDPEAVPNYRHINETKRLNRKMSDNCYRVVSGPPAISDFVELKSRFSFCDVRLGISAGWIPDGTILERDGMRFQIEGGKKVRMT
jgi:hypothetical protein